MGLAGPCVKEYCFLTDTCRVPLSSRRLEHYLPQMQRLTDIPHAVSFRDRVISIITRKERLYNYLNSGTLAEKTSNRPKMISNGTKCIFHTNYYNLSLNFFLLPPHSTHSCPQRRAFSLVELSPPPLVIDVLQDPVRSYLLSGDLLPHSQPCPRQNLLLLPPGSHRSGTALSASLTS